MRANNTTDNAPKVFRFSPIKFNKHDTIYQAQPSNPNDSFITELVKIEKFQGYSNAYNLGLYFRIRDASSWAKSKQITGLFKTTRKGAFYGNIKEGATKTLLLFKIDHESHELTVYEYPKGYDPHRNVIDSLINTI
jgi:hypothetical protein